MGMFSNTMAVIKVKELQKRTGKPFNECSSALHLADGDINKAIMIMRKYPEHDKRIKK